VTRNSLFQLTSDAVTRSAHRLKLIGARPRHIASDDDYLAAFEKGALLASRESDRDSGPASVVFKGQSFAFPRQLLKATVVLTSVVCIAPVGARPL
jgi:hypothetical protein